MLAGIQDMSQALSVLADTIAPSLPGAGLAWEDALFRLLSYDTVDGVSEYLRSRGVTWRPRRRGARNETSDEVEEIEDAVVEALITAPSPADSRHHEAAPTPPRRHQVRGIPTVSPSLGDYHRPLPAPVLVQRRIAAVI